MRASLDQRARTSASQRGNGRSEPRWIEREPRDRSPRAEGGRVVELIAKRHRERTAHADRRRELDALRAIERIGRRRNAIEDNRVALRNLVEDERYRVRAVVVTHAEHERRLDRLDLPDVIGADAREHARDPGLDTRGEDDPRARAHGLFSQRSERGRLDPRRRDARVRDAATYDGSQETRVPLPRARHD